MLERDLLSKEQERQLYMALQHDLIIMTSIDMVVHLYYNIFLAKVCKEWLFGSLLFPDSLLL